MKVINDLSFDCPNDDEFAALQVFQVFTNVFNDQRGYFTEVLKDVGQYPKDNLPLWMSQLNWIKQINRSSSQASTIRGCHALKGIFCQGKFVEALTEKIYDIITDARPDSKTFGLTKIYLLDPIALNKLWVPRGFLHAFAVPKCKSNAIFLYFCDNTYNKESEFGINPLTLLPKVVELYKQGNEKFDDLYELFDKELVLSDKDKNNLDYETWMKQIQDEYTSTNKVWYK